MNTNKNIFTNMMVNIGAAKANTVEPSKDNQHLNYKIY